ncbi:Uncharacterised protein [Vibrio cholerae]|nr:Uncharacterised protein [Vibrio cholerae]
MSDQTDAFTANLFGFNLAENDLRTGKTALTRATFAAHRLNSPQQACFDWRCGWVEIVSIETQTTLQTQ